MTHVIYIADTTGEHGALWIADEIKPNQNQRLLKLGRCVADKVSGNDVEFLAAAIRDHEENLARRVAEQARNQAVKP